MNVIEWNVDLCYRSVGTNLDNEIFNEKHKKVASLQSVYTHIYYWNYKEDKETKQILFNLE